MYIYVGFSAQEKCFREMIYCMSSGVTTYSLVQKCRGFILVGGKKVFILGEIDY